MSDTENERRQQTFIDCFFFFREDQQQSARRLLGLEMCVQWQETTSESSKFLAAPNGRRAHRQCCCDKIRTRQTAQKIA